jgi:hypothetical protein
LKYYKKNILNPLPKKEEDIHIEWSKKQQRVLVNELETEQAEYSCLSTDDSQQRKETPRQRRQNLAGVIDDRPMDMITTRNI